MRLGLFLIAGFLLAGLIASAKDAGHAPGATELRQSVAKTIDDYLDTMKDAPDEEKYFLSQKIFWLRGNLELCSFHTEGDEYAKCLRRLPPEGDGPFRDVKIGEFKTSCAGVKSGQRNKDCAAAAKKAQQTFKSFAKEAAPLLPNDGALIHAARDDDKITVVKIGADDLAALSSRILKESEAFRDRSGESAAQGAANGKK